MIINARNTSRAAITHTQTPGLDPGRRRYGRRDYATGPADETIVP
jgi:hypothetical protein